MTHRRIHLLRIAGALLALAALDPAPATADLIVVKLQDATYEEEVWYNKSPSTSDRVTVAKGSDPEVAEVVTHSSSYSKGPFTFQQSGTAVAGSKGPVAIASLALSSSVNNPDVLYAEGTTWEHRANAYDKYQVAVVNVEGTANQHVVPVHVKGKLKVWGNGSPESPWDLMAYAAVGLNEDDDGDIGDLLGHIALEMDEHKLGEKEVPFLVPVAVAVGKNRGDFSHFWVWVSASVALQVYARHNRDYPANTSLGSGHVGAWADPYIYIDPTWEFADRYALVFSPNVENAVPEPGGAVLMLTGVAFLAGLARPWRRRAGQRSSCSKVA